MKTTGTIFGQTDHKAIVMENKPPKVKPENRPGGPKSRDSESTSDGPDAKIDQKNTNASPSEEEVIKTWRQPVTNQDEQEKITNDGGNDIPTHEK